jgi:lysylphosphatidylglycerol synthetase-like protein (DUF2156 family)
MVSHRRPMSMTHSSEPQPPSVADMLAVDIGTGARALVVGELRLTASTGPGAALATTKLVEAIEAWSGPGVLVFNGGLLAPRADAGDTVAAHPRLVDSVAGFAAGAGRRVVVIPGERDAFLAWDAEARAVLADRLGAEFALAVELKADTAEGTRTVMVEPGQRFDPLAVRRNPRSPDETPLVWHLREEMLVNVRRGQPAEAARGGWLDGLDDLDDPGAWPRFFASRFAYRRLARHAWLLVLPFAAALALRLPVLAWNQARGGLAGVDRLGLLVAATVVELTVLAGLAVVSVRRTWDSLANVSLGQERQDLNQAARGAARDLVTAGHAGLITSHTGRAQLVAMGPGFFANTGCAGDTVSELPSRLQALGLPPVFAAYRQVSWVELEAGAVLHCRLVLGRRPVGRPTAAERLAARWPAGSGLLGAGGRRRRPPAAAGRGTGRDRAAAAAALRLDVVAAHPPTMGGGEMWPAPPDPGRRDRRVRRAAAVFVAAAGFLSLVSALSQPLRDRLHLIEDVLPLAVPEVAGALAAIAGVGLLFLARGIRRGQRRAWVVCQAILVAVAVLHLIKGVDVEEAVVCMAVAAFLWFNRGAFVAASDVVGLGRGLAAVGGAVAAVLLSGTLGLELGSYFATGAGQRMLGHRGPVGTSIGWQKALAATAERLVGYQGVALAHRLDRFFSPAMGATGATLAVALAYVLLRPVVSRRAKAAARPAPAPAVTGAAPDKGGADEATNGNGLSFPPPVSNHLPLDDLDRARAIFDRYGSGTLDYFALRSDKEFFFWESTVVAYAVYGGACLVSPDPIGPPAEREGAWREFRAYADKRGWSVGVLGAGEEWLPIYRSSGMHDLYVGDEGVVRVERFTLEGGKFKGLRQAVNRVAKYGYSIEFYDPADLGDDVRAELEEVMTKSRRGDVERGFSMTLGRAFRPEDRGLLLGVVYGPPPAGSGVAGGSDRSGGAGGSDRSGGAGGAGAGAGRRGPVVAFCQYVPAPGIGGYSLDLMRRDNGDHPNGLIDFAVVETIRYLKTQGMQGLGLNFATMRAVLAGEAGEGLSQKVQAWLLKRMGDSMQIESLWRFNAKYDPDWQPRYALYDAPENALAMAFAVARAESFWELPVIGRFLVPKRRAEAGAPPAAPGAPAGPGTPVVAGTPAGPGTPVAAVKGAADSEENAGDQGRHRPQPGAD